MPRDGAKPAKGMRELVLQSVQEAAKEDCHIKAVGHAQPRTVDAVGPGVQAITILEGTLDH